MMIRHGLIKHKLIKLGTSSFKLLKLKPIIYHRVNIRMIQAIGIKIISTNSISGMITLSKITYKMYMLATIATIIKILTEELLMQPFLTKWITILMNKSKEEENLHLFLMQKMKKSYNNRIILNNIYRVRMIRNSLRKIRLYHSNKYCYFSWLQFKQILCTFYVYYLPFTILYQPLYITKQWKDVKEFLCLKEMKVVCSKI